MHFRNPSEVQRNVVCAKDAKKNAVSEIEGTR